jgi:hypothetical protein
MGAWEQLSLRKLIRRANALATRFSQTRYARCYLLSPMANATASPNGHGPVPNGDAARTTRRQSAPSEEPPQRAASNLLLHLNPYQE